MATIKPIHELNSNNYYQVSNTKTVKTLKTKEEVDSFLKESTDVSKNVTVKEFNKNGFVLETRYVMNEANEWIMYKPKMDESYLNKFKTLVEYTIKPSSSSVTIIDEDDEVGNNTEIPNESPVPSNTEFEDTEAINDIKSQEDSEITNIESETEEEVDELAKKDEIDRVKEIQDMQTLELQKMTQAFEFVYNTIDSINKKIVDIDSMKSNIDIVNKKVEKITPLSAEDQLEKNVLAAGGMTIQDVWNKYILDNSIEKAVSDIKSDDEQTNLNKYSEDVTNLKNSFNEIDIKRSLNIN